jgi:hypothetical protein
MRRKGALVAVLAVVFLPFGVPRWLEHDTPQARSHAQARLARLCRSRGGTLGAQGHCTIRYGRHLYLMDAVTPAGFDEDTARYQRQGCAEARSGEQAGGASRSRRPSFVYHPATGVCEHRE